MSRIFVNGDSITYGYWDERTGGWANLLKAGLMKSRDYAHEVTNFALGNQTLNKIIDRFPDQLRAYGRSRSLGVLMLGASDSVIRKGHVRSQNPITDFKRQLPQLDKILTEARVTPLFVGLYPVDETRSNPSPITGDRFTIERGLEYDEAIRNFAENINAPYVDLRAVWHAPDQLLSFDGVHPSTKGHEIIAREVTAAVHQRLASPLLSYVRTTIPG
jgi:lysophospholipase L1-like esterase